MPRRRLHALYGNLRTLKELPVAQHHAWMITWSVGGLTKQGGASEGVSLFGEISATSVTRHDPLSRVLISPTGPRSYNKILLIRRAGGHSAHHPLTPKIVESYSKEDLSCGRQGTIAKFNTFTIANEQSVNDSLYLCEPIASLPYVDTVLVETVYALVDPVDDRIDSSSKIDLCPPSVDTYALKDSSLSFDSCVEKPSCECSSLVEGSCNVIKKPQFGGTNENVDHLNRSDSLSISFVQDPIACFAHKDHVLENASKNDMCLFEGELACSNSSMMIDHSLFKYNILLEDDEITPSDVPSGVNNESSIVLDSYTCYSNPLSEAFPPKDGNIILEDESTLGEKECDEDEGGACFPITSSSWCVSVLNGMTSSFEPIHSHTHENTLEEVDLRDTCLYYLFTYDDAHAVEWSMLLEDEGANREKRGILNPI
uniref:Uncharacterized protein n=1 Tax=Solanum tuberosum TaxID=4113 RepID=M1DNY6_SOLTU